MMDAKLCRALHGRRKLVRIHRLATDSTYQRPPDREKVQGLSRKPSKRPIFVNRRSDGTLWIIDGQHRALGARARGRRVITAYVVSVPQPDEGLIYAALNGTAPADEVIDTSIVKEL